IGLTGGMDPDCRKCMVWEKEKQDQDLLKFTQDLIAVRRKEQKILSEGSTHWVQVSEVSGVIIYERLYGGNVLRGAFNTGIYPATIELVGETLLDNLATLGEQTANLQPKGFILMKG